MENYEEGEEEVGGKRTLAQCPPLGCTVQCCTAVPEFEVCVFADVQTQGWRQWRADTMSSFSINSFGPQPPHLSLPSRHFVSRKRIF